MILDARDRLLNRREAAEVLGVTAGTLAKWGMDGRNGLPTIKVGRAVRYRRSDLDKWLESRTVGAVPSE